MKDFLKLIRWGNLLMIAFTMFMVRYCLMDPMFYLAGIKAFMSHAEFSLLVLSTVCIAAGGYIINDYYDISADAVNKPLNVIIDKAIKGPNALLAYYIFTITGIGLGFLLGYRADFFKLGFIHVLSAGLLYYYSLDYKRRLIIGNLMIAFMAGMVPLTAGLFEKYKIYISFNIIVGYAIFAFLLTLIREIIKDAEDIEGDRIEESNTIPIAWGINITRIITILLTTIVIGLLGYIQTFMIDDDRTSFFYILMAIQVPLLFLISRLSNAKEKQDFSFASGLCKFIMLTGILYMAVFRYTLIHS